MSFPAAEKLIRWISLKTKLQLKLNIYYQSAKFHGILLKEMQKILCFAFRGHVDLMKYRKNTEVRACSDY